MTLEVIRLDGKSGIYKVKNFEFRANQISSWIRLWLEDDNEVFMHQVAVVRLVEE